MGKKYIVIRQYLYSHASEDEYKSEYFVCRADKRKKADLKEDYVMNDKKIAAVDASIECATKHLEEPLTDARRRKFEDQLENLKTKKEKLQAFIPKAFVLHYNKIEKAEAKELIAAAKLVPVLDNEQGTVWDTKKQWFTRYKGNIVIPDSIGY